MNYTITLIKHNVQRGEFWICTLLYSLFLTLPLYQQYYLGATVPVYHFLVQSYLSASTSVILVMIACFPLAKNIVQEKNNQFLYFSLLRSQYKRYITCQFLSNIISCTLLISIAYIVSVIFISFYAPFDISDTAYHMQYVHSYFYGNSLLEGNPIIFYIIQWLLQLFNTLFYLGLTMLLSLVVSDMLIIGVFPLILYSVLKVMIPLIKIPLIFNPNIVYHPIHHLKTLLPPIFNNDFYILLYILAYSTVVGYLSYLCMLKVFKKQNVIQNHLRL